MRNCLFIVAIFLLGACASKAPYDYTLFKRYRPKSILVLPPLNKSTDVRGTYSFYSTVTQPLAEMGYYVFPIAIIDRMMKENGLPTAGEMHQAPLHKIVEIINPDAVMYITLEGYGSKYEVLDSTSLVKARAHLLDAKSGTLIWAGEAEVNESQNQGSNGLLGQLIGAAVAQAVNSSFDHAHGLCGPANQKLFQTKNHGLLYGPYHPEFGREAP